MATVKVKKLGDGIGVAFLAETQARLGLVAGDDLMVVDSKDGITLRKQRSTLELQMELACEVLDENAEAPQELSGR